MPPFARRRPLLRAAAVGGGAYLAGRAGGKHAAAAAQQETAETGKSQQATAQPEVPRQAGPSMADQLNQLTMLHEHGSLTDAEFAAAKARLLNDKPPGDKPTA